MSDQKVRLTVSTKGFPSGSLLHVSEEVADELVANRQAVKVGKPVEDERAAKKSAKG